MTETQHLLGTGERLPGQDSGRQEPARPPGRPRSERAEKAIIEATLDLLAEEAGVAGVSIEAVAARAGVGKTTIYRRWPNKEALIVDALAAIKHPIPEPAGRSVREDLLALVRAIGSEQEHRHTKCFWNVLGSAEKHPGLLEKYRQEVIRPRRDIFRRVLRRGAETGELRSDIDVEVALSLLIGAVTMQARALAPLDTASEEFPDKVVDAVLRGLAPRPPA
ncbi:MAG: TetR/AcrR family transcriptional regulator [Actinomadura sp.]